MANNQPIGFFDSGVGGISVLKKAMELLPHEDFIYFGDSVNAPYGDKDLETIRELSFQAVDFLLSFQCKSIVVACNTATSAAISDRTGAAGRYRDHQLIAGRDGNGFDGHGATSAAAMTPSKAATGVATSWVAR